MSKFLRNIILFSVIFLVLNTIFYSVLTVPLVYENYIFNSKCIDQCDKFLLSDSHGANLKSIPSEFEIFNFGFGGDNYIDMFLKTYYLANKLNGKDTILLTVDSHTLSVYREEHRNLSESIVYGDYDLSLIDEETRKKVDLSHRYLFKYLPLLDVDFGRFYYQYLKSRISGDLLKNNIGEFTHNEQLKKCETRYIEQFGNKNKSVVVEQYLYKIIDLCKEKGIVLIGLKYPISNTYYQMIKNDDYGAAKILEDNGCPVINLETLYLDHDEYFADQDHLNREGAKAFCKKLSNLKALLQKN